MQDDETIREFLIESHENLDQLDRDFVALEADPTQRDRIAGIFRTIHTIKGTAGFLSFRRLETLTHSGESLLSLLRDGALTLSPAMTSALLTMVDRVRAMLSHIESSGSEGDVPIEDVMARLTALRSGDAAAVATASVSPGPAAGAAAPLPSPKAPATKTPPAAATQVGARSVAPPVAPAPPRPVLAGPASSEPASAEPEPTPASPASDADPSAHAPGSVSEGNVRVDVGLLDKLMNLVGELVLARNQILQSGARIEEPSFLGASQRLNLITTELQEQVMKTRMQPIGNVWSRLPRVVRDLAIACGKQVRIEMSGKETELDRTVLEAIKDPLTHIVRNSVDHGIERPDVRAGRNKPKTGTLRLRAFHEGGQVNIEIADDGGGMNLDAIKKKALERGVVTAERVARMNDRELMQLVFLPGFSTAEKVTNVSGRGVGMDVVKTNIEKIGGTVDLMTASGRGTTIRIKIPLTLAIVPALIVSTGGQRYAIPQGSLVELVGLDGEQARGAVEWVHGTPVYRLRGRLLPLVSLNEKLRLGESLRDQLNARRPITIVVLSADERQFGLVVDDVRDTEEIVVKPLGRELKGIPVFAGATIMGDGRVALILDVMGLAMLASAVGRGRDGTLRGAAEALDDDAPAEMTERQAWLLFGVDDEGIMAMPLSDVARLEEFPRSKLERAGRRSVVQYRGAILPLIHLEVDDAGDSGPLSVIVHAHRGRSVGFVVRRIIDVVEAAVRVERVGDGASVLGAAVVQGRVTDLLDVTGAIERHLPEFLEGRAA